MFMPMLYKTIGVHGKPTVTKHIVSQIDTRQHSEYSKRIDNPAHPPRPGIIGCLTLVFHQLHTDKSGLYSRFLTEVRNSGDSTLVVNSPKSTVKFKAEVIGNGRIVVRDIDCSKFDGAINTGNGTLVVTGTCTEATLTNTGVGTIQADNLKAERASCRFFGKGTTGVWATELLQVKGALPGKLYYRGKPEKIKNYSVGVKIIPMASE